MPSRTLSSLKHAILVLTLVTLAAACGGKRPPALATAAPGEGGDPQAGAGAGQQQPTETIPEGPDVRSIQGEGASGADIPGSGLTSEGGPLADIRFLYDSSALTDEARGTLEKHALWLQGQRGSSVVIEGHCDERGTTEYNLALGEQRARTTREYLVGLGVDAARLRVVSYGKERLLDPGADEAAHARNRRAHFNVR
ncbi:MAG TPA: OmpA family protein [Vicinamibacteria bacterium]|jgi:peptidoglycan-associated lipoprotein